MERRRSDILVGRDAELARLRAIVARADGPTGVFVVGEAGVGKSRLVSELLGDYQRPGLRVLRGQCLDVGRATIPYAPFIDGLRRLARDGAPRAVGRRASEVVGRLQPALDRAANTVMPAVGLAAEATNRTTLFADVLEVLDKFAAGGRCVVVLEDLHWADDSTLGLVEFLARNGVAERLLLMATVRPTDDRGDGQLWRLSAELARHDLLERVFVQPLQPAETSELVLRLGGPTDRSALDRIHQRSGGNPFFIEALLAEPDPLSRRLPLGLRDILAAQLAQLPSAVQRFARALAIAGENLPAAILGQAAGLAADDVPAIVTGDAGKAAFAADASGAITFRHALLREAVAAELGADEQRRLHHALAEALDAHDGAALYAAARAVHWEGAGDLVRALRASVEAARQAVISSAAEQAATHYARAAELRDAVERTAAVPDEMPPRAWLMAAAAGQWAVAGQLRRARAAAEQAVATTPVDDDLETWTQLQVTRVYCAYRLAEGDAVVASILEETEQALRDRPEVAQAHAFVLSEMAFHRTLTGRAAEALEAGREALERAIGVGDMALIAEAHTKLACTCMVLHRIADAQVHLGEASRSMRTFASLNELAGSRWSSPVYTVANMAQCFVEMGEPERAVEVIAWATRGSPLLPAEDPIAALGQGGSLALEQLDILGGHALERLGRWPETLRLLGRSTRTVDPVMLSWTHSIRGRILAARGQFDEAETALRTARVALDKVSEPTSRLYVDQAAAELAIWQGRPDVLRAVVAAGLHAFSGLPNQAVFSLPLHVLRLRSESDGSAAGGTSPTGHGRPHGLRRLALDEARETLVALEGLELTRPTAALIEQCRAELNRLTGGGNAEAWARAAAAWHELKQPYDEAYCRWRLGEAHLAAGRHAEATSALLSAQAICSQLGARPLGHAVARTAGRAGLDRVPPGTERGRRSRRFAGEPSGGLSPRELEVLGLIADGATNRDIATRLLISEKTAGIHVSNILRKLDVANRGQAAAAAHRRGLVPTA